ncbi:MAG TPA: hypothetical protein VKQ28_16855 [Candidatus Acidoferrum sp.]|nr:hypothetical protein [Candidatus Acidoferrum sp.]
MSEQNVLNPTQTSLFNPDWGYTEGLQEMRSVFQPQSGKIFSRFQQGLGRVYDLAWNGRDLTTKLAFQQWENQYRDDYFTLADYESSRYFTGRFDAPLVYSPRGNSQYDIKGRFVELPGVAIFAYPSNWTRDAVLIDERNSAGEDLVKLTGTWTDDNSASNRLSHAYVSATTGSTAEWVYWGYGCRVWSLVAPNSGQFQVTLTDVWNGAVNGPFTVDGYNSVQLASAPLLTILETLGLKRLKIQVLGTKNAASTGFNVYADAIEVMR